MSSSLRSRPLLYCAVLAFLVASPTIIALGYYQITGDPTLRPLALTIEALAGDPADEDVLSVKARVRMKDPTNDDGVQMAKVLRDAFSAKGVAFHLYLSELPPDQPSDITFFVRRNQIGPYPLSRAVDGVQAAVDAYRLEAKAAAANF